MRVIGHRRPNGDPVPITYRCAIRTVFSQNSAGHLANFPPPRGRQKLASIGSISALKTLKRLNVQDPGARSALKASYVKPSLPSIRSPEHRGARGRRLFSAETDAYKAALKIKRCLSGNRKSRRQHPQRLEVLQTRKGDCNEHTVLFNALARAAGIPADGSRSGLSARRFLLPRLVEIWLGDWVCSTPCQSFPPT